MKTPKEYLIEKYPEMEIIWGMSNIDDDWIARMMKEYSEYVASQDKWIDFKDEKPKYYEPVLCFGESIFVCWLAVDDNGQYIWTVLGTNQTIENITHWSLLPPPPKTK